MDYQAIYDHIIKRNHNTPKVKKQTESHHIIPKSFAKLDGIEDIDGTWNRVNLPLREHFICHLLLARIWRDHKAKGPKMGKAFTRMSNCRKFTSKDYKWLRINCSHSEETKRKIGVIHKGMKHTPEAKQRMSDVKKGKPKSFEHIQKVALSNKGRKNTDEAKQRMSLASLGKPKNKFRCYICDKEIGGEGNFKKHINWHNKLK